MEAPRFDPIFTPSALTPPRLPTLWAALGLIVLYFALQFVVGSVAGLVIGLVVGFRHGAQGGNVMTQMHALLTQPDVNALMVILTLLVAAGLTIHLTRRLWPSLWPLAMPPGFGFAPARQPAFYAIAALLGLILPFIGGLLTQWLAQGHEVSQDIKQLGAMASPALRIPLALLVMTVGPLVEELLFRGVLLSSAMRHVPAGIASAITALLFACVHLPDLGFLWYALPNLLLLGLVLAWLRVQSGSIWPAVIAHSVNNALAVVSWFVLVPPG
ncbi:CPBP family intramembrane glutamic endopeptidase [Dyella subtropica]|uniref:CPBP family intramembrane glutamic endopeptidase n=1 Tax=Dyella subtropica TaxID=2992127 RepID=UPI00224D6652|nr:type II CAAX endopeptidase family protein [Dyella subtropica]